MMKAERENGKLISQSDIEAEFFRLLTFVSIKKPLIIVPRQLSGLVYLMTLMLSSSAVPLIAVNRKS
jgi:hypothetical protein